MYLCCPLRRATGLDLYIGADLEKLKERAAGVGVTEETCAPRAVWNPVTP